MDTSNIWKKIIKYEGEVFYTITGLPFSYRIDNDSIIPIRNGLEINRKIPKTDIEKTMAMWPISGPSEISSTIQGPSYVYGILSDKRILG
ncbi:MAG: hypothetical protein LBT11_03470 [Treponema sp.]|nr:hypothetical protein [Treponema sp.]